MFSTQQLIASDDDKGPSTLKDKTISVERPVSRGLAGASKHNPHFLRCTIDRGLACRSATPHRS